MLNLMPSLLNPKFGIVSIKKLRKQGLCHGIFPWWGFGAHVSADGDLDAHLGQHFHAQIAIIHEGIDNKWHVWMISEDLNTKLFNGILPSGIVECFIDAEIVLRDALCAIYERYRHD